MLVQLTIKRSGLMLLSVVGLLFIMSALWDYENWLLERYDISLGVPQGLARLSHEPWVRHVQQDLASSDFSWQQYVRHVEAGDGDHWFFEHNEEPAMCHVSDSGSDEEPMSLDAPNESCVGCGSARNLELLLPVGRYANATVEQRLFCSACIEAAYAAR